MTLNNQTLPTFNGFSKFNRYVIVYCDECSGTQYSCECYQKDIFKKKYYCHICEGECSCGRMPYLLVNKPNLFDTSSWTNYNYLTKAVTICNDKTDKITYYENWDLFIPSIKKIIRYAANTESKLNSFNDLIAHTITDIPLLLLLYHLCYNMKVRRISNTIKSLFVNNECNIKEINDILDRPKRIRLLKGYIKRNEIDLLDIKLLYHFYYNVNK